MRGSGKFVESSGELSGRAGCTRRLISRYQVLDREWNENGGRMRRAAYRLGESSNQHAGFWRQKSAFVGQMNGARRAFSVRLSESIELPRDTLDEDWSTALKTRYEFESGWTTCAVEGFPASSEE